MSKFKVFLIFGLLSLCESYKILVVYPFPARSHNTLGNGVIRHLLQAGHEITYITPFPVKNPHPNLKVVDVSEVIKDYPIDHVNVKALMNKEIDFNDDDSVFFALLKVSTTFVNNENVQTLIHDTTQNFDVVVAEWMYNDIYSGFGPVFDCPFIWVLPYPPYANILSVLDDPPNPAYTPNLMSDNVPPYNFWQRVKELFSQIKTVLVTKITHASYQREIYEKAFGPALVKKGKSLPSFDVVRSNASMVLGNSHFAFNQPLRLPPNFKLIGGYYIEDNVKPLPKDLQELMDNAKNGVIYFSLGSNLKSKDLPDEIKSGLVKMFGQFKETIIWKFEEELTDLPKNVHIVQWAPQQSILAHQNCKLFITHGGLLSTTESVHFGVPTIGIPIFCDQYNNVGTAVQKGMAKRVDLTYSVVDDLREAIREMTTNTKYTIRAREISMSYHDQPLSPGAELVHWVEHVVRTRGAPHLRSPALMATWYQKLYLDLAVVIIVAYQLIKILILKVISKIKTQSPKKKKN